MEQETLRKSYLASNLKLLRRQAAFTQQTFSEALNVKRPTVGAWEEGRAEIPLPLFLTVCNLFAVDPFDFYFKDLSNPDYVAPIIKAKGQYNLTQISNALKPVIGKAEAYEQVLNNLTSCH